MKTDNSFVDFAVEQMQGAGMITSKAMFGGHMIYCEGKPVALICDNQLFVKPTEEGRAFIGKKIKEAPPYPRARLHFLIEDQIDNEEWLSELIRISFNALPEPKPKRKKRNEYPCSD